MARPRNATSTRGRKLPSSPAEIMARRRAEEREIDADPARWGDKPLNAGEKANLVRTRVTARLDSKDRPVSMQRTDVFDRLRAKDAISDVQLCAVRRLERDMAERARIGAKGQALEHVDRMGDFAAISDKAIDAGGRVDEAMALVGPANARLFRALIETPLLHGPGVDADALGFDWREAVTRITGETRRESQSCLVRMAATNLAEVYDFLDSRRRRSDKLPAQSISTAASAAPPAHAEGQRVALV